ncbi:MAG: ABC transporter ATP-binding protein [Ruminococcus sp.]|nr:ABC transporter ATP-binding protein [Ruminococcus sp.]MCM1480253.1 ABC transporter ATP-binding protein [Muribaculaceae bacterium]
MKNILISGKNICKNFSQNSNETQILKSVNVDIYEDDFTVIMGASGAGKSTLLYALSGMDGITGGEIIFNGENISALSENKLAEYRAKKFGFVFQQTHLVSNLTLFENVAVAGCAGGQKNTREIREKANKLLTQMHAENAADRLPSQVSGGEAQRAAIARAMINDPAVIFADEPTGALNKSNSEEVMNLFTELNQKGQSILMVTHDIKTAIRGNRILYLEDGKILDGLELSEYGSEGLPEREKKINGWLSALQW